MSTLSQKRHTRYNSSGLVISPAQRPLPDNTQQSRETDVHDRELFEPTIPVSERRQTHALDRATTGIGCLVQLAEINLIFISDTNK